jgi:hypothetical protein
VGRLVFASRSREIFDEVAIRFFVEQASACGVSSLQGLTPTG